MKNTYFIAISIVSILHSNISLAGGVCSREAGVVPQAAPGAPATAQESGTGNQTQATNPLRAPTRDLDEEMRLINAIRNAASQPVAAAEAAVRLALFYVHHNNLAQAASAYEQAGRLYGQAEDNAQSLRAYNAAIDLRIAHAETLRNPTERTQAYNHLAIAYINSAMRNMNIDVLERAITALQHGNPVLHEQAIRTLAQTVNAVGQGNLTLGNNLLAIARVQTREAENALVAEHFRRRTR